MDYLLSEITLEGPPISKKRPRVLKNGRSYDPQREVKQFTKNDIYRQWVSLEPEQGPLEITFFFEFPYPKSWSKSKKANFSKVPHIVKPDIDNLIKYYMDCMNEIVYFDDRQVVRLFASKCYCDHVGSTFISIERYHETLSEQ